MFFMLYFVLGVVAIILYFKMRKYKKTAEESSIFQNKLEEIGAERYDEVTEKVAVLNQECEEKQKQLGDLNILIDEKSTNLNKLEQDIEKKQKQLDSKEKQINKVKSIYASITYCIDNFLNYSPSIEELRLQPEDDLIVDELSPNVMLKLRHMDVKSLKKEFKNNQKNIDTLLSEYQGRYTTKTNKSIYSLMTIGLSAELQNVLFNLRFENRYCKRRN